MTTPSTALYYPTIEFRNYDWLWRAALLWDRVYRIVPTSYTPEDPPNVQALIDGGEIGIAINPEAYAASVAKDFMEKLEHGGWGAAALSFRNEEQYALLHPEKVDVYLREMMIARGATKAGDWLRVPEEFAALYMTFLANEVARRNKLTLLSDDSAAWTGSTYFAYDGEVDEFPHEGLDHLLATFVIREYSPEGVLGITPTELLRFREKYRDERQRFFAAIRSAAERLSECEDPAVVRAHVEDIKRDIEAALKDYKGSMSVLGVAGWTGLTSVAFPMAQSVAAELVGKELNPENLTVLGTVGAAVGLVSGLTNWNEQRKAANRAAEYSYLMHLRKNWKGLGPYGGEYNYFLCRQMEEFIAD